MCRSLNCPTRLRVVMTLVACAVLTPNTGRGADGQKPSDAGSAVEFIEAYVALYRDEPAPEKLADRLASCWDLEAFAADVFGADMPAAGTPGRAALAKKVGRLFGAVLADKQIRETMRQVKALQPIGLMVGSDRAAVSFVASDGKTSVNNLFVLHRSKAGWKITESANGGKAGRGGFAGNLRTAYKYARGTLTPVQFVDEIIKRLEGPKD